jgi:hypothetical protein
MGVYVGKKYGNLTVLRDDFYVYYKSGKCKKGLFKCDCGALKEIRMSSVVKGETSSCGCIFLAKLSQRNTKHGLSKHPLYRKWLSMKNRCYIKSNVEYKNYGGRGISVCDEWKDDFKAFFDWSINNGYSEKLTIDRVDVNGNYSPYNCVYIPMHQQYNNRTDSFFITIGDVRKTITEWSRVSGNKVSSIRRKIYKGVEPSVAVYGKKNIVSDEIL